MMWLRGSRTRPSDSKVIICCKIQLRHWLANSIDQVNELRDFTNNHDSTAHLSPRVDLTVGGDEKNESKGRKTSFTQ